MRILEELYCGRVNLHESAERSSALREKLLELLTTNDQRMLAMLTEGEMKEL